MKLYHGGFDAVNKPVIQESKYSKDFGRGFYCTEYQQQAERWAKRYHTPIVSVYAFSQNSKLDTLGFDEMTGEWLDFIVNCRSGKTHKHDVVTGAMANDQVWNYVADYISGVLTREQFWVLAKFKHPTHQIVYKRLILNVSETQGISPEEALEEVYTSWISEKIDDYNSSMYYESPQYLSASYYAGEALPG